MYRRGNKPPKPFDVHHCVIVCVRVKLFSSLQDVKILPWERMSPLG